MRMQQQMMKYMMIFMGLIFFKMPSGLCVYFIASTLWGLAERKLIPKYEFKLDESTSDPESQEKKQDKPVKEKRQNSTEAKESTGTFGQWWKNVTEKAAQPRTLHKSDTGKGGKKKKKK